MTNLHAGDDDMYSGFDREDVAPALETNDLHYDSGFQAAVKSSYGRRPPTSGALKVPGTGGGLGGILATRTGRIPTTGRERETGEIMNTLFLIVFFLYFLYQLFIVDKD